MDFFSVSLTVGLLQKQFNRSTHDITTAITLTLLFRSAGAVLFGIISDRYGVSSRDVISAAHILLKFYSDFSGNGLLSSIFFWFVF
jgi:MFS family permease